jgi:hypothetical protein
LWWWIARVGGGGWRVAVIVIGFGVGGGVVV